MRTSERSAAFIAAHEGVVTRTYRDVAGVLTIGVGHTASAGPPKPVPGMTISREEAFAILARDLARFETRVAAALGPVPQHVFDGAVSFDFNTGAIHRASWVAAYLAGDEAEARRRLMLWVKAGGRSIKGLVRRREAEARLIFSGDYGPADIPANATPMGVEDVRQLQRDLAALGLYDGEIDGISGPMTRAAVLTYQRGHSDLTVDGIVGPATRASLSRDMAVRRRASQTAGVAIATGATGGAAAAPAGVDGALLVALAVGAAVLVGAGGLIAWRYRREIARMIRSLKGTRA